MFYFLRISDTLGPQLRNLNTDSTLGKWLSGSVKLTKNCDLDKYMYSGYGIRFDSCSEFLFADGSYEKNAIIFGADMSSSVHVNNKGKDILVICEEPGQESDDTTLTAEPNILLTLRNQEKSLQRLHHNGSNSFFFV